MKRILTLILLLSFGLNSFSVEGSMQKPKTSSFKPEIKLSLFIPGILVEQKFSKKFSAEFAVLQGFSYTYIRMNQESFSDFNFYTYLSVEPRYFTSTKAFGAVNHNRINGYFGFPIVYGFNEKAMMGGVLYGFQGRFGKMGFYSFSFGYGFTEYLDKIVGVPFLGVKLGIVI